MLSNTREKTLTTILGVSVVAAGGYSVLESQILQPLDAANAQVSAAQLRNTNLETEFAAGEHAQRNLGDVVGQSLPEDPSIASVMYQEWLLQRSNEAGFESPLIIPGSPIPVDDVGAMDPIAGDVKWAENSDIGYFAQDHADLFDSDLDIFAWMSQWRRPGDDEQAVRTVLGRLLFSRDQFGQR